VGLQFKYIYYFCKKNNDISTDLQLDIINKKFTEYNKLDLAEVNREILAFWEQENINGKQVFKVAEDSLFACFDQGIDEAFAKKIAKEKPLRIVFRDNGFANDTAKINVQQLLKQLSPETEMKMI
jgi:hypothetical protein